MAINTQSVLDELMASIEDMGSLNPNFKGLIYGNSGTGKTVFSMQIMNAIVPEDKLILYIDAAEGYATLRADKQWHPLIRRTKRLPYQNVTQIKMLIRTLRDARLSPPEKTGIFGKIGGIILDESSSMADKDLLSITRMAAKDDPQKSPDKPTQPDMGVATVRWSDVTSDLNALPMPVIQIAHERVDKDDLNREVRGPSFMPRLSANVRRDMHLIGYMAAELVARDTEGGEQYNRWCQVHPTTRIIAKSRLPGLDIKASLGSVVEAAKKFSCGDIVETGEQPTTLDIDDMNVTTDSDDYAPIIDED